MNMFRSSVRSGKRRETALPIQTDKRPRAVEGKGLGRVAVPRDAVRTADHRDDDRHRLVEQTANVLYKGAVHVVELVNLSGGGAMVCADFTPTLWDRIDLLLGENGTIECAVRWIRGDRLGLEFAHETQVGGDAAARDTMLLDVLRTNFPDLPIAPKLRLDETGGSIPHDVDPSRRAEVRHPLIWSGTIHFDHDSVAVRLRNISPTGALVETPVSYAAGTEVYLDLGEAGQVFAYVSWALGDQIGLTFAAPFDIAELAKAKPEVAPYRWTSPEYLREAAGGTSPWAANWKRLSVDELKTTLESFLRR